MKKSLAVVLSGLMAVSLSATTGSADNSCPVEVSTAKSMLQQKQQVSRVQDVQAPRSLAGARIQEAPRSSQEAPRSVQQAPRSQQEAPRSVQEAPRGQQLEAPRGDISKAASLVKEAEAACKAGNNSLASQKAKAAIEILK